MSTPLDIRRPRFSVGTSQLSAPRRLVSVASAWRLQTARLVVSMAAPWLPCMSSPQPHWRPRASVEAIVRVAG